MADGHPLVYLDSANTSQKPQVVIDAMVDHLERHNANVARAMHQLGAESTAGFEGGRDKVAAFLNAPSRDEVIFTKNASEAINLVANTLAWARGPLQVGPGDEVLITEMEHHSNIVPWQLLTQRTGATLRWFGLTDDGQLDLSTIDELINERTKVVSLTWVSNMLGTVNPVAEIDGIHPHDISQVLDSRGIAVRAGHHCAKPAHKRYGVQSSTRMSSYLYTTPAEIDALVEGLEYTKKYFTVD